MAQERYVKYQDKLISWVQNIAFLGPINPGLQAGFNQIVETATLTFQVGHVGKGISVKDPADVTRGPWGMWISPQGSYIREDAPIQNTSGGSPADFTIPGNLAGPYPRYDWVYGEDRYMVTSPIDAKYGILIGDATIATGATGIPPAVLTDSFHQTPIGCLVVPPGAITLAECTWVPYVHKNAGHNYTSAKLDAPNVFSTTQQWCQAPTTITGYELDSDSLPLTGFIKLPSTGNQVKVSGALTILAVRVDTQPVVMGSSIRLIIRGNTQLRSFLGSSVTTALTTEQRGLGYSPIFIPGKWVNEVSTYSGNEYDTLNCNAHPGGTRDWEVDLVMKGVTGIPNSSVWVVQNVNVSGTASVGDNESPEWHGWQYDLQTDTVSLSTTLAAPITLTGAFEEEVTFPVGNAYRSKYGYMSIETGGGFTVKKDGQYKVAGAVALNVTFTDTAAFLDGYDGPGPIYLNIMRNRGGLKTYFQVGVINSNELLPYWVGRGGPSGPFPPYTLPRQMQGNYIIQCYYGDILSLVLTGDIQGTCPQFDYLRDNPGKCQFSGEYLGNTKRF